MYGVGKQVACLCSFPLQGTGRITHNPESLCCLQRGFATLYNGVFSYPDRRRMRVSQVLVLPPFQRQGVGRAILQSAYALADTRNAHYVTVRTCALCDSSLCIAPRQQKRPVRSRVSHLCSWPVDSIRNIVRLVHSKCCNRASSEQ